jgi:hypothetical protein
VREIFEAGPIDIIGPPLFGGMLDELPTVIDAVIVGWIEQW